MSSNSENNISNSQFRLTEEEINIRRRNMRNRRTMFNKINLQSSTDVASFCAKATWFFDFDDSYFYNPTEFDNSPTTITRNIAFRLQNPITFYRKTYLDPCQPESTFDFNQLKWISSSIRNARLKPTNILCVEGTSCVKKTSTLNSTNLPVVKTKNFATIINGNSYGPSMIAAACAGEIYHIETSNKRDLDSTKCFFDRPSTNYMEWSILWQMFDLYVREFGNVKPDPKKQRSFFNEFDKAFINLRNNYCYDYFVSRINIVSVIDTNVERCDNARKLRNTGSDMERSNWKYYTTLQNRKERILHPFGYIDLAWFDANYEQRRRENRNRAKQSNGNYSEYDTDCEDLTDDEDEESEESQNINDSGNLESEDNFINIIDDELCTINQSTALEGISYFYKMLLERIHNLTLKTNTFISLMQLGNKNKFTDTSSIPAETLDYFQKLIKSDPSLLKKSVTIPNILYPQIFTAKNNFGTDLNLMNYTVHINRASTRALSRVLLLHQPSENALINNNKNTKTIKDSGVDTVSETATPTNIQAVTNKIKINEKLYNFLFCRQVPSFIDIKPVKIGESSIDASLQPILYKKRKNKRYFQRPDVNPKRMCASFEDDGCNVVTTNLETTNSDVDVTEDSL